ISAMSEKRKQLELIEPSPNSGRPGALSEGGMRLHVTLDMLRGHIQFGWIEAKSKAVIGKGKVTCTGLNELTWEFSAGRQTQTTSTTHHANSIRAQLKRWLSRLPVMEKDFSAGTVLPGKNPAKPLVRAEPPFGPDESPWAWL